MITVNRRDRVPWHDGMTVSALLTVMKYTFPHIVVSIDGVLVPHDRYKHARIPDEANVLVIHLMAGG